MKKPLTHMTIASNGTGVPAGVRHAGRLRACTSAVGVAEPVAGMAPLPAPGPD